MTVRITDLPFVESKPGVATKLWVVEATGEWADDNATGRAHATALITYMQIAGSPGALGQVCRALGQSGQWTGIEVGFFQALAEAAV